MSNELIITYKETYEEVNALEDKLKSIEGRVERLNVMRSHNEKLISKLKDKLEALKSLDKDYEIFNQLTVAPTIFIKCNDAMLDELKKDTDLSVHKNEKVYLF